MKDLPLVAASPVQLIEQLCCNGKWRMVLLAARLTTFVRNKFFKVSEAKKKSSLERRPLLGVYAVLACNIALVVGQ